MELRQATGGFAGGIRNYLPGNGNTMIFELGGSVGTTNVSFNGAIAQNGTYRTTSVVVNGQRQNYLYIKIGTDPETQ